jgi:hypothetical protein
MDLKIVERENLKRRSELFDTFYLNMFTNGTQDIVNKSPFIIVKRFVNVIKNFITIRPNDEVENMYSANWEIYNNLLATKLFEIYPLVRNSPDWKVHLQNQFKTTTGRLNEEKVSILLKSILVEKENIINLNYSKPEILFTALFVGAEPSLILDAITASSRLDLIQSPTSDAFSNMLYNSLKFQYAATPNYQPPYFNQPQLL